MAVFRIERTRDYTVMSNHHLKDTALSLKAKGLLSMMLSLPDEWNYTTRGLAAICKEGVDAIGGALRELEKAGYIVRRQLRGPGGRISDTEYTIYEKPCPGAEEPPEEPGPDTTPPDTGAPDTAFPYLVEPDMVEPSTEKPAELNTKRSNTQKSNTHLSNTHSFVLSAPELEGMKDVYEKREEIREQIEYDLICTPVNRTQVDEFVELMLEVAMTRSPTIKIGRDAEYPTAFVQERFEQINSSHIEKVLEGISINTTRVWNTRAYLLAALFNAPAPRTITTPCWSTTIFTTTTAAEQAALFHARNGREKGFAMKRPLAYITAPWGENEYENTENAARWCRQVYDAGFSPVCPLLFLPLFLEDGIPQEHKDGIDMARDYLRRARVLVVCGGKVDETVKNDIATAERLRITATTLDGILTVKGQGRSH